ncbi:MAG TPA: glycosyltransferase [Bryobacteraceae bacterium]|nr:glycosyltransferase [Bryobacteraceae bacterium]
MKVAAVIPNWNGAHLLRRLFLTLASQVRPFEVVIVVDNGSSDDSVDVSEQFGATVLRFDANRGFAAAVNAGFAATDAHAVAVLNNDVELSPTWLEVLLARLTDDETVAFVSGKTVTTSDPSILDGAFDAISRGACALRCGSGRADGPYWSSARRIQFTPLTAVLIRTKCFRSLGGLDELFESYLEDVDFGLRCASLRYSGGYEPAATARHVGSATLGSWNARTVRNIARNQVLLLARHYDAGMLRRFGWSIAVGQLLWGLVAIRHGATGAWIAGKIEGLLRFRSSRMSGNPQLIPILEQSEQMIRDVQTETGEDLYWRLYFALTSRLPRD